MARPNPDSGFAWNQRLAEAHGKAIRLVEEAGGSFEDWQKFLAGPNASRLGLLVMGKLELWGSPCQRLVPHLLPNWAKKVVEDVDPTVTDGSKLLFLSSLRDGDSDKVDDRTMRKWAVKMTANKGLSDVPALLGKDGKGLETIPVELRGKAHIVLSGTVLWHSDGFLLVPFLVWNNDAWVLRFDLPVRVWSRRAFVVSCE